MSLFFFFFIFLSFDFLEFFFLRLLIFVSGVFRECG
mgnify:CR=1 FL=1